MAVSDAISDFLTGIRNAYRAQKKTVTMPSSTIKQHISAVLKEEGYIQDYTLVAEGVKKFIHIKLRYLKSDKPAIINMQRVSTPGLRIYVESQKIPRVLNGLGTMIISTSRGIMSDKKARRIRMGGELLCKVW